MGAILQNNNNNDNNYLMKVNSAIYAFGSLMETIHIKKIETVIPDSINLMTNLFTKNNEKLSKTLSWCFSVICSNHQRFILESNNLFSINDTLPHNTITTICKEDSHCFIGCPCLCPRNKAYSSSGSLELFCEFSSMFVIISPN